MIPFLIRPFRRRLTLTVILVTASVALAISVATLVSVRAYRWRTFRARAADEAGLTARLIPPDVAPDQLEQLLVLARTRSNVETVAVSGSAVLSSDPVVTLDRVPTALRTVGQNETRTADVSVAGRRYYVVATRNRSGVRLFVFFSVDAVDESLRQFATILLVTALIVTVAGATAGSAVARRTLRPIRQASLEARRLAEDLTAVDVPPVDGDEFESWIASFNFVANALADRIEELSMARERERAFTSDVAHELRTPVASLVTAASMLEEDVDLLPPPARRTVELLSIEARRLRSLLADVMELSRFDAGADDLVIGEVDLADVVRSSVGQVAGDVTVDLRLEPAVVRSDRRRLERIVENLVCNAIEHGRVGVEIRTSVHDPVGRVTVLDRGPGIPPEHLGRIFDRFYKVDRSRSRRSTGVGLAIAAENAAAIGGEVTATNRAGGGAVFQLEVPVDATGAALIATGARGTTSGREPGYATPASG